MSKRIYILAAVLVAIVTGDVVATSMAPLPTMKDLAQVWMGGEHNHILWSRLELSENGTGTLIIEYSPSHEPQAYRVTSTRLAEYDVQFTVEPIDTDAEPITLSGAASAGLMELKIAGASGNWESDVRFDTSARILAQIEAVNRRAQQLSAAKGR